MKFIRLIIAFVAILYASSELGKAYRQRWNNDLEGARQTAQRGIDLLSVSVDKLDLGWKTGVLVGLVILIEEIAYQTHMDGVEKKFLSKSIDQLLILEKKEGASEYCKSLPFLKSRLDSRQ